MLDVHFDTSAIAGKLDALFERMAGLDNALPEELAAWQRDDMNRQRPVIERPMRLAARTTIWPTSRRLLARRILALRRMGSRRPILRPELYDALRARMRELLQTTVAWR